MKKSYRQSLILFIGTIINSLLGLGFYILVARNLSVASFGSFSYLLGLGLLAAELGDLGINTSIVKFGAGENFSKIFSFALVQRAIIFVFIIAIFFPLGLFSSAFVAISLLLASLATQSLLARQKFGLQISANIFGNLLRLVLVFTTPISPLGIFFIGATGTFVVGILVVLKKFRKFRFDRAFSIEVLKFSLPTAGSFSLASLSAKIDVPIIFALAGPGAVGVYSAAQKLISIFPQIAAALDSVFAPKFSAGKENFSKNFREYLVLVVFLAIIAIAIIPVSNFLIPVILGSKYIASIGVFQILLVGMFFLFLSGPFAGAILYHFGKVRIPLFINAIIFAVTVGLYMLLVPQFGAVGAAVTGVVGSFVGLCLYFLFFI